jgi:hypothetical protein
MPAHTLGDRRSLLSSVLDLIFAKMATNFNTWVAQPQRRFLSELFRTVFALQGRATFINRARFSSFGEQTFRRWFARSFNWVAFNLSVLRLRAHPSEHFIGVFDASFLPKSGKRTWGLDRFFSSTTKRTQKGLEVSLLGLVSTQSRETFVLDATQTPPGLSAAEPSSHAPIAHRYSRIDFYLEQITDCLDALPEVRHWVGDGYYAKRKVFDALRSRDRHLITKLRPDADLRHLALAQIHKKVGRPRRYAGKVRFSDFDAIDSPFSEEGCLEDLPHVRLYSELVHSVHFDRDLRLVVLHNERDGGYLVLASTDLEQAAEEIVMYYRLRYQIEFAIRDAKQFTGLTQCQARDEAKLDFHLNLSMAAVNLGRLLSDRSSLSFTSYVREAYNAFLVERLLSELSLGAEFEIIHPGIARVIQTGRIAA